MVNQRFKDSNAPSASLLMDIKNRGYSPLRSLMNSNQSQNPWRKLFEKRFLQTSFQNFLQKCWIVNQRFKVTVQLGLLILDVSDTIHLVYP